MSREKEELQGVTLLGNQKTKYPQDYAPEMLETFINKHQDHDYFVMFTSDWAIRWAETHNETLKLSEFGNI